jgi:hypothetical protein
MTAKLVVSKDTGELLLDTRQICYGLVKSGNMAYVQSWYRRFLKSAQLDPNNGANWTDATVGGSQGSGDDMWGFTVTNAISPIVFIVGPGCLNGSVRSGNTITFMYANCSAATKFYCFDLMANNIAGSPYLKTYRDDGVITFNSLQPPLNVVAAIQAPGPSGLDANGHYISAYAGGYNVQRQNQGTTPANKYPQIDSRVDVALTAGVEYAAYLPWARSCGISDIFGNNLFPHISYGGSEGAYGRFGGISFMFGAAGATTQSYPPTPGWSVPCSFFNIPTDRYPIALVIKTAGLPFPYN